MDTATKQSFDQAAYEAAYDSAILVDRSRLGTLKISGDTRFDLLNRMSTQAVEGIATGEGRATILTTDIARIIDRLILYASSDAIYALTSEDNADSVARYLMRFVFFQDDFHLQDVSADTAIFGIYGCQASKMLSAAGFPETELPLHHWRLHEIAGVMAYIHRTDPVAGDGYFVMCSTEGKESLRTHLLQVGIIPADEPTFELLRIESGLKRFGHELTSEYIPLEADLWDDVSFSKGCYIGQEIIARMESRGRLAKRLVKLRPAAPVGSGAEITAGGKKAGKITSVAIGPSGPVALGFVKTAILDENLPLEADGTPISRDQ
jgi:aminomethyltransferase